MSESIEIDDTFMKFELIRKEDVLESSGIFKGDKSIIIRLNAINTDVNYSEEAAMHHARILLIPFNNCSRLILHVVLS